MARIARPARRRAPSLVSAVVSAWWLALAGPAGAAMLDMGGALEVRIFGVSPLVLPQYPGTIPVDVSSNGGAFTDPAGIFYTNAGYETGSYSNGQLASPLFTGVPMIVSVALTFTNASGSFAPGGGGGGGFGGSEPLDGVMRINVLGVITVPVSLGVVGNTATASLAVAQLAVTVVGRSFTTGAAVVTGITTELTRATPSDAVGCAPATCGLGFGRLGVYANTVTLSGADNRTAGHRGSVALVSPVAVLTNAGGNWPAFVTKRFSFVPEPGTLVLLASAAAAAVALGARRR